jgi:hypothetical protein
MGQTSYVYILWLVILVAGLWLILGFGSLLHAREDFAGEWELTPEQPSAGVESQRMVVEQSGQYFRVSIAGQPKLDMKMTGEALKDQHFGDHKQIVLTGGKTTATFEGRSKGDLWRLSFAGQIHGDFIARLVDRTYPKPAPATRPSAASLSHAR